MSISRARHCFMGRGLRLDLLNFFDAELWTPLGCELLLDCLSFPPTFFEPFFEGSQMQFGRQTFEKVQIAMLQYLFWIFSPKVAVLAAIVSNIVNNNHRFAFIQEIRLKLTWWISTSWLDLEPNGGLQVSFPAPWLSVVSIARVDVLSPKTFVRSLSVEEYIFQSSKSIDAINFNLYPSECIPPDRHDLRHKRFRGLQDAGYSFAQLCDVHAVQLCLLFQW